MTRQPGDRAINECGESVRVIHAIFGDEGPNFGETGRRSWAYDYVGHLLAA